LYVLIIAGKKRHCDIIILHNMYYIVITFILCKKNIRKKNAYEYDIPTNQVYGKKFYTVPLRWNKDLNSGFGYTVGSEDIAG